MTKASIQKLIAQDQVPSALEQMMALLNAYLLLHPKDQVVAKLHTILITNAGKYEGLKQDQALGILKREDEQITLTQVKKAILYLLDELPDQIWQTKASSADNLMPSNKTSSSFEFDLFLSFSSKDREAARLLWETLRGLGYRVFLSDEALKAYAGMSFLDKINAALRQSQHFLLLCTTNAVESPWVKLECETFFTRFHLPAPQQRRFFIFERGGKKALVDVYQNLQTLEELPHLIELLQSLQGQANQLSHPIAAVVEPVTALTQAEQAIETRLKQEQAQLEQAASTTVAMPPLAYNADLKQVKKSALLLEFYQKYGEKATTAQFLQLHESIALNFGEISELDLDDLIAELAREEHKRAALERQRISFIETEIPQAIQAFVAEHKGEWVRRQELTFLDELSRRFNGILAKAAMATMLDEAREHFHKLKDFIFIKGGAFLMGAPQDEPESLDWEKPQHQVQVSNFYLSKYPVTLAQFEAFIQATGHQTDADLNGGSNFWTGEKWELKAGVNWRCDVKGQPQNDKQHPVIHVSWNDAKAYCAWLTEKLKLPVRLPYEAEWEYACRAGTSTPFNTGVNLSTEQANYDGNFLYNNAPKGTYLQRTSPVGTYAPNGWGLHDMHGNVWEWCEDWYNDTYYQECAHQGLVIDPKGPDSGSARVLRGGSWSFLARFCRTAYRYGSVPAYRGTVAGFRPVVSL